MAVTTAHHAATVTHVHHSATVTTVQHAPATVMHDPLSADAMIVQHAVAMIVLAAHAPTLVADALQAHVVPPAVARSQHVVTSRLVQSARLDQ